MRQFFKRSAALVSTRQLVLRIALGITAVAVLAAVLYGIGRKIELGSGGQGEARGELAGRFEPPRTVDYHGATYQYRNDLLTVLVMGIDRAEENSAGATGFRNGGQADFLLLLVFDSKAKAITPIHIDRDTMAEITVLGVLGSVAGTRNAQICLSHGFGDGGEQSSLYTADAVGKLLYGVEIDFYISVNMDAISMINDALGGIPVTLKDDFTSLDPSMTRGSAITLRGEQAEYYVRGRMGIGIGTNEARMERQREYLSGAGARLAKKLREDAGFLGDLLDDLGKSLQSNMSRGRMINEFYGSRDFEDRAIVAPVGEHVVGKDGFMEYHMDEASLEKLVIELFFTPQEAL